MIRYLPAVSVGCMLLFASYQQSQSHCQQKWQKVQLNALQQQWQQQRQQAAVIHDIEQKTRWQFTQLTLTHTTLRHEVPHYVTVWDDTHFRLPIGFLLLYNAAFTGQAPRAPRELDREPAAFPLSDVAQSTPLQRLDLSTMASTSPGLA